MRQTVATCIGAGALLALALTTLCLGDYALSPREVLNALVDPDAGFAHTVVAGWRLPRAVAGIVFGAALGISGALFQSLTDNALGSPDIIGFSAGSYTGALVAMLWLGLGSGGTMIGALVGGLMTAGLVYLLAWRDGINGFRLIIIGIGVTAALNALNLWVRLRARTEVALSASFWGTGSLSGIDVRQMVGGVIVCALCFAGCALISRPLRQLELGDDTARSHGVHVEAARLGVLAVGVALVAVVTAMSGPIAFVALTAPQVAARVTKSAGLPLVASGVFGGIICLASDLVAQRVGGIPVGSVTVVVGGAYLVWLLAQEVKGS